MPTDYDFWSPLLPADAVGLMAGAPFAWWLAGGWALDLFLGRQTRPHEDLDIALFHADQLAAHEFFTARGFELHAADPPGTLRPWLAGERLAPAIHDVWCRRDATSPWQFQLMLNPRAGDGRWMSRRDASITRDFYAAVTLRAGIPCLAPEIQLHFKAKSLRPKDDADFAAVLPALSATQRDWLRTALAATYPAHRWLAAFGEKS